MRTPALIVAASFASELLNSMMGTEDNFFHLAATGEF